MSYIRKISIPENETTTNKHPRIVIIGRFPPVKQAQSIEATRLAYSYHSSGLEFRTVTGAGTSTAQVKLSCKTHGRYKKSYQYLCQELTRAPLTVLFADLFARPKLQSKTMWRRIVERVRWLRLLWCILLKSKHLILIKTGSPTPIISILTKIANHLRHTPIISIKTSGAAQFITDYVKVQGRYPFEMAAAINLLSIHKESYEPVSKTTFNPISASNLTIYGLTNSATGLGQNARMSYTCFKKIGLSAYLANVDNPPLEQPKFLAENTTKRLNRQVILHHLNADRIKCAHGNHTYNIGFLLWELGKVPKEHLAAVASLDEIWAPSKFVAQTYRQVSDKPVICMKKGIELPSGVRPNNNPDRFTCLNAFDFHSSVERKNPLACVHAFQLAFPKKSYPECRLLIKTTPTIKNHWGDPNRQMQKIRHIAFWDPRIIVIEGFYTTNAFHKLIANANAVISTHRAEGFGYIPAYGLAHGLPVITTDYGGSTDFCTAHTSLPVHAALVPVPDGHSIYQTREANWADVSPDAIAEKLRWVYGNQQEANRLARTGQSLMQTDYSISAQAERYKNRLIDLGCFTN